MFNELTAVLTRLELVLNREFSPETRGDRCQAADLGLDIAAEEDVWRLLLKAPVQAGVVLVTGDLARRWPCRIVSG